MSQTLLDIEPSQIRAGETVEFEKTFADYLPSESFTLKYKIIGDSGIANATVTPDTTAEKYTVTFTNKVTKALAAGKYTLYGWVEYSSGDSLEVYKVYENSITVLADLSAAAAATDTRSNARIILDQIETAIINFTIRPLDQLTIDGKVMVRPNLLTLQRLRNKYVVIVNKEIELANRTNGRGARRILGRFGSGA